jgi:hypothetical protein
VPHKGETTSLFPRGGGGTHGGPKQKQTRKKNALQPCFLPLVAGHGTSLWGFGVFMAGTFGHDLGHGLLCGYIHKEEETRQTGKVCAAAGVCLVSPAHTARHERCRQSYLAWAQHALSRSPPCSSRCVDPTQAFLSGMLTRQAR